MIVEFQIDPRFTLISNRLASGYFYPGEVKATDVGGYYTPDDFPCTAAVVTEGKKLAMWAQAFHSLRLYLRRLEQ